jgi:sugar phosphate isomerase/epimerase
VPIETVIDKTAKLGVAGVDILHRQMDIGEFDPLDAKSHTYCRSSSGTPFRAGVDLICLSIHQDFVSPNPAERHKWEAHTEKCIEIAYAMGVPCIRLNSGRWKTIKDFDELMKARGNRAGAQGLTPRTTPSSGASSRSRNAWRSPRNAG